MTGNIVCIAECSTYDKNSIKSILKKKIDSYDFFHNIHSGITVGLKVNLVSAGKPETAIATHPVMIAAVTELLVEKGAKVIIGDSSGGPWTRAYIQHIYTSCGMDLVKESGGLLNDDYSEKDVSFHEAKVCKSFRYTAWLDKCDCVINICKLKSHGMMGMSNAVKNMFGVVPGTIKPEYHFRFSNPNDFADMLIDICEYVKPVLHICDGIVAMQGNGPTRGEPYPLHTVLISQDPYALDWVAARLIGMSIYDVPTLQASKKRGFIPENFSDIIIDGEFKKLVADDFKYIKNHNSLLFSDDSGLIGTIKMRFLKIALSSRPEVKRHECIGCGKCSEICPAHAILMNNGKPTIDRKKCIMCFCCQEFCPKGALKVHRSKLAKMITH